MTRRYLFYCGGLLAILALIPPAGAAILDLDSAGNGQKISGTELSPAVSISSAGANLGTAIFDSNPNGPNMFADDSDLLVDRGNLLILQTVNRPQDFGGSDFFEFPDDEPAGGTMYFDWTSPVTMSSIDLVDIDDGASVIVTLTDTAQLIRVYSVPFSWTGQIPDQQGFATLDLTTLSGQPGPFMGIATAMEDVGFNASAVAQMSVFFSGSGGLNNIVYVPEPVLGGLGLLALGLLPWRRRQG